MTDTKKQETILLPDGTTLESISQVNGDDDGAMSLSWNTEKEILNYILVWCTANQDGLQQGERLVIEHREEGWTIERQSRDIHRETVLRLSQLISHARDEGKLEFLAALAMAQYGLVAAKSGCAEASSERDELHEVCCSLADYIDTMMFRG